jgi:hypothetical protein
MKRGVVSLGLFVLVTVAPFSAWAVACPVAPRPNVSVQVIDPPPTITTDKSLKMINASATGQGLVHKGSRALGTTQSEVEASMNMNFVAQKQRRGQGYIFCMNTKLVTARFGHNKLIVNLPREYRRGSCQYNVVHRHEMAHVDVNRQGVRKYAVILKSELERELQRIGTLDVNTMGRGTQIFEKRLKAVVEAVTARFNAEIKGFHGRIDSLGSPYAADGACRSW